MFSSFFEKKVKNRRFIIIDIGSESIGAAFVISKDCDLQVVDIERKIIPFQEKINVKRFIVLMQDTLSSTIDELVKRNKDFIPEEAYITLASPWHASQTRVVHVDEKDIFTITELGLKQILDKEAQLFNESRKSKGESSINNIVIESNIIEIKINGYEVEMPIGRKTNNMQISMHVTTSPEIIINSINNCLTKKWINLNSNFKSFTFSAFNAIRDISKSDQSFIIVDILGEITDISLVRNNVLLESISYPIGNRSIIRSIGKELNLNFESAYSEFKLWQDKKIIDERENTINNIILKTTNDWSMLFAASIKQMSVNNIIPRNIYLISDEEYVSMFTNSILDKSIELMGENQEKFKVETLNEKILKRLASSQNINKNDLFLYVTIIMLEKLLNIERSYKNQYLCQTKY